MDLVAGVRKEGSRGGRDSFKWSDVKESSHRENYLGHSLMAPVGRWQQGRDLNWYAKNSGDDSEEAAARAKQEREEELRRVKEAEQDAMARALGLPVAPRSSNPNMTPLGGSDVQKAIQESTDADDKAEGGRGIGFGSYGGGLNMVGTEGEILAPVGMDFGIQPRGDGRDGRSRGDRSHHSRRDRSRETGRRRDTEQRDRGASHKKGKDPEREHRRHHHRERRENRRHYSRSRSTSRSPRREHRHRGDSRERRHDSDRRRDVDRSGRHRSRSPRRDRTDPEIGRDRDLARDHRHRRR